jgi:hypothetical protein
LVSGIRADRWRRSPGLERAVARLEGLPLGVGDWDGQTRELDRDQIAAGDLAGYVFRRYENRRDGRVIDVILTCGRAGPVCAHTPDVCEPSAGNELLGRPVTHQVADSAASAEFWAARFQKADPVAPLGRRVLWAWSTGGAWRAPDEPRLAFLGCAVLYKLYVIQEVSAAEGQAPDQCDDFLREFLPQVEKAIGEGS